MSAPQEASPGPSASRPGPSHPRRLVVDEALCASNQLATARSSQDNTTAQLLDDRAALPRHHHGPASAIQDTLQSPPPQYPVAEVCVTTVTSSVSDNRPAPPPFSSLFVPSAASSSSSPIEPSEVIPPARDIPNPLRSHPPGPGPFEFAQSSPREQSSAPAYDSPTTPAAVSGPSESSTAYQDTVAETKRALPQDTKAEGSSRAKDDESEPPPAYSEGYSPLQSFSYLMAAAGGASSIITQVQQGGPPINTLGGKKVYKELHIYIYTGLGEHIADLVRPQMLEPTRLLLWTFGRSCLNRDLSQCFHADLYQPGAHDLCFRETNS